MEPTLQTGYLFFWRYFKKNKKLLLGFWKPRTEHKISPVCSCPLAAEEKQGVTTGVKLLTEIQCLNYAAIIQVGGHLLPLVLQT